jgi:hypothetical protein
VLNAWVVQPGNDMPGLSGVLCIDPPCSRVYFLTSFMLLWTAIHAYSLYNCGATGRMFVVHLDVPRLCAAFAWLIFICLSAQQNRANTLYVSFWMCVVAFLVDAVFVITSLHVVVPWRLCKTQCA